MPVRLTRRLLLAALFAGPTAVAADPILPPRPIPVTPAAKDQVYLTAVIAEVPTAAYERLAAKHRPNVNPGEVFTLDTLAADQFVRDCLAEKGNILSRPQLLLNDGQTGFFQVGQQYPLISGQSVTPGDGARLNITYTHTGLTLRVTPTAVGADRTEMKVEFTHAAPKPIPVTDPKSGAVIPTTAVDTQSFELTQVIPDGRALVADTLRTKDRVRLLILNPTRVRPDTAAVAPPPAPARSVELAVEWIELPADAAATLLKTFDTRAKSEPTLPLNAEATERLRTAARAVPEAKFVTRARSSVNAGQPFDVRSCGPVPAVANKPDGPTEEVGVKVMVTPSVTDTAFGPEVRLAADVWCQAVVPATGPADSTSFVQLATRLDESLPVGGSVVLSMSAVGGKRSFLIVTACGVTAAPAVARPPVPPPQIFSGWGVKPFEVTALPPVARPVAVGYRLQAPPCVVPVVGQPCRPVEILTGEQPPLARPMTMQWVPPVPPTPIALFRFPNGVAAPPVAVPPPTAARLLADGRAGLPKPVAAPKNRVFHVAELLPPLTDGLQTKVFPVADMVTPIPSGFGVQPAGGTVAAEQEKTARQLVKLVTGMVRPQSWKEQGGKGSIEFFGISGALVVTQTPETVREVDQLLASLRKLQDSQTATEVRVIRVPAGAGDGCKLCDGPATADKPAFRDDIKLLAVMEAVQRHAQANVCQMPKMTAFNGQTMDVVVGEVTPAGRDAGVKLSVQPVVSADQRFVRLSVNGELRIVSGGEPLTVKQTAAVPDGKTVILYAGRHQPPVCEFGPPVVSQIPYVNRLFKNVAIPLPEDVFVAVTPRIVIAADEAVTVAPPSPAAGLVAKYKAAAAAGKTDEAVRLGVQALALDPHCFAR